MLQAELIEGINEFKLKRNAVILAHYYTRPEVQDMTDFVGDSPGLSQETVRQNADVTVFCGVHFMGESSEISVLTKLFFCLKLMRPVLWLIW